jgi:hypothetical protein
MTTSIRQQLIDAVVARMALIRSTSSYQTDIGANVRVWHPAAFGGAEFHGVNIMDVEETTEDQVTRHQDHKLMMVLDVHAKQGVDTAAYLRNAIADIWAAIGTDRYWTVNSVRLADRGTQPMSSKMLVDQAGKIIGVARIQFQIGYRTAAFNPFSQSI